MRYLSYGKPLNVALPVAVEMPGEPFKVDISRFKIPYTVKCNCPHCGHAHEYKPDYLSFPTVGAVNWHTIECYGGDDEGCGKEFAIPVFIECRVRVASAEEIAADRHAIEDAPAGEGE